MTNTCTDSDPEAGLSPVQPRLARHDSESVLLQLIVADSPGLMTAGTTDINTVGADTTPTVTLAESSPPAPVQAMEKLFSVLVSGPIDSVPDRGFTPDQSPEAVHAEASVALQRKVTFLPTGTVDTLVVKVTTGTATTAKRTELRTVPATPRQESE